MRPSYRGKEEKRQEGYMYEKGSALRRNPALTSRNGLRFPHSDPTSFATRNALLLVSTFDRYRVVTSLPERTGRYYNLGMVPPLQTTRLM